MTKQTKIFTPLLFAVLIIGFLTGMYISKPEPEIRWQQKVVKHTQLEIVPGDTVYIQGPAKIKWRKLTDTQTVYKYIDKPFEGDLFKTAAFEARLDSIRNGDTVNIKFMFPEMGFLYKFRPRPDTVKTITIEIEVPIEEAWWVKPAYILSGAAVGFMLGNTK